MGPAVITWPTEEVPDSSRGSDAVTFTTWSTRPIVSPISRVTTCDTVSWNGASTTFLKPGCSTIAV